MARTEQIHEIGELMLKGGDGSDNFATAITELKMRYQTMLAEEDKITTLFSVIGKKDTTTILSEQQLLKRQIKCITVNTLK